MAVIASEQSLCSIEVFASGLSFCCNSAASAAETCVCCAPEIPDSPAVVNACVVACGATA